jgi:hypothetical protein
VSDDPTGPDTPAPDRRPAASDPNDVVGSGRDVPSGVEGRGAEFGAGLHELGLDAELSAAELQPLVDALRSPASAEELAQRDFVVARMTDALTPPVVVSLNRGRPMLGRFSRRSVVIAAAATFAFGGVAAAAGGGAPLRAALGLQEDGSPVADDTTSTLECPEDVANHGEFVSGVAQSDTGDENHGSVVSEAAQSDCGKADDTSSSSDESTTSASTEESSDSVDETDETTEDTSDPFECPDDVKNHGEFVSGVAKDKDHEGNHGSVVSEAAQSDCGKPGADDEGDGGENATEADESAEVEDDQGEDDEGEDDEGEDDHGNSGAHRQDGKHRK